MASKTVPKEERCCGRVHNRYGVDFHQCARRGTKKEGGKLYCRQHAPSLVKARKAKGAAAWDKKLKDDEDRYAAQLAKQAEIERRAGLFEELVYAVTSLMQIATSENFLVLNRDGRDKFNNLLERAKGIGNGND